MAVIFLAFLPLKTAAQDSTFHLDPQRTTINFTLGDVLHTVHGTFHLKEGTLRLAAASGKLTGEIVVDARSGESGNSMRDRKMHKEVLESDRYPEIIFRPDRVDGEVTTQGKSTVRVHGTFNIHGSDHELTVPAEVQMAPGYWTATLHFAVPYAKWGMKNPSTMFLRVSESVDIDLTASGIASSP
ncbi:MAG: YceI family protein [Candidatus Sulfotelmatobacter sp.]|jgi:polyisoprenoid-binding protein YceI